MAKKVGMVEIERDKFKRAIELEEDLRRQSETKVFPCSFSCCHDFFSFFFVG